MRTETKLGLVAFGIVGFLFCLLGGIGSLVYLSLMPASPDSQAAQSAKDRSTTRRGTPNTETTDRKTTNHAPPETNTVVIRGTVQALNTTGFNERVFWTVEEGKGYAFVEAKPGERVVCVFKGGVPASLKPGEPCRLEGRAQGVIPTAGIPLYTECVLAPEEKP